MYGFDVLDLEELDSLEGGCFLCKLGATIAGASSGAGVVFALVSNPAGWLVAGGVIIGGGVGYLTVS